MLQDLTVIAAGMGGFLALLHLISLGLAALHLRRTPPKPTAPRPPISLIRPVCGRDPKDELTLGSSFAQDYPDFELLFCAAVEADPAVPLVRQLIAAHPGVKARLLIGDDKMSGNPKLNNVAKGWNAAASDWIVMSDSNLLLPPDYLSQLQAEFAPGVGMVSSPAVGTEPDGLAAHFECAWLNTNQARWQLLADQTGRGFAQGKSLFYRRKLVEQAGGLAVLGRDMAEDIASTKITRAAGLTVRLPPAPFPQPLGKRRWAEVWKRQVRWAKVRRLGFPGLYAAEILNGVFPFLIFASLGGLPAIWLLPAAGLWYAGEWSLAALGGWPRGGNDLAMWVLRDLSNPVLWVQGWIGKGFEWRGNAMSADETTDMAQKGKAAP